MGRWSDPRAVSIDHSVAWSSVDVASEMSGDDLLSVATLVADGSFKTPKSELSICVAMSSPRESPGSSECHSSLCAFMSPTMMQSGVCRRCSIFAE